MSAPPVVYVLDDDDSVRRGFVRLLESYGWQVSEHGRVIDFQAALVPGRPGCLLLDLRMPDVHGLDLLESLTKFAPLLSVVVITGYGDVQSSVKAMKLGAVDFLSKPVDEVTLVAAIGTAITRSLELWRRSVEQESLRSRIDLLTPREREVCGLVVQGLLNKQIAGELGTSEKTVKVHRARVMNKLQVQSVAQLVRLVDRAPRDTGSA
jgi:RNA polymerase sigma factor (sigma-70 family)